MKKILTFLCCLISVSSILAQTGIISFQPDDLGIGIGYRTKNMYAVVSHGEYKLSKGYMEHSKIALGGVLYPQYNRDSDEYASFVTFGLCLHSYNKQSPQEFQRIVTYPLSFELGVGAYINKFSLAFRFDIIKNESSIDIGIKF